MKFDSFFEAKSDGFDSQSALLCARLAAAQWRGETSRDD
jgi:hypothetical protein